MGPKNVSAKINDIFLVKLSTAIAYLIGNPNYDAMAGKYYARFFVKHEDKSDSLLKKSLHKYGSPLRMGHMLKRSQIGF